MGRNLTCEPQIFPLLARAREKQLQPQIEIQSPWQPASLSLLLLSRPMSSFLFGLQLRDAIAMWQDGISSIFRLTKSPLIGAFISWSLSLGAIWSFFYVFIRSAAQLAANLIMNPIHHPKNTKKSSAEYLWSRGRKENYFIFIWGAKC